MDHKEQEQIALHRWAVIAEAASDRLTPAERGSLARQIAARAHTHPDGSARRYSRGTIDRWLRAWRSGGLEALEPAPRADTGTVRAHPELFAEAAALRLELPARSAAQIASILFHRHGVRVAERTVRAQLRRAGLHRAALGAEPKAYGRYEAARPNERWITDVLVGPWVPYPKTEASVRARLFLIVDDHSRLLADGRFFAHENARACQDLTAIDVFLDGRPAGTATPFIHPPARAPCRPPGRPPRPRPHRHRLPRPGRHRSRGSRRHRREDRLHAAGDAPRCRQRPGHGAAAVSAAPWAAHFGLARTPFGKNIPARDLFGRPAHAEAIARISFCVVESALGVVTGDVGAGKTVALRAAVAGLDPTRHQVIYIANPSFGTRGLYVTIVRALGDRPRYLKAELMAQAGDLLAAEAAERHRRVVVILDEAHLLDPAQLEELRLLTNSEMDSASPFAAILAGQPTLNRQLRMGIFAGTSGSPPGSRSSRWTWPNLPPTSSITWHWPAAASRFSLTMRSPGCTASPTGSRGRSTTPLSPRSSPPPRAARTSSTTPAPKKPSPSSPGTDHAAAGLPGARQPGAGRRRAARGPHQPRGHRPDTPARRPSRAPPRHRRVPRPPPRRPASPHKRAAARGNRGARQPARRTKPAREPPGLTSEPGQARPGPARRVARKPGRHNACNQTHRPASQRPAIT